MPDIAIVPTSVLPGDGAQYANGLAGVAIAAGDVVYLDVATQKYLLAESGDVLRSKVRGIAAHGAAVGQPVRIQTGGVLNLNLPLLAIGEFYVLSGATAGKIAPYTDLAAADFVTLLGVAQSTSLLQMRLWVTELAKAA